jgi:hypothetical protein
MKKKENDFIIFKLQIRKMCDDTDKNWRLALGEYGSDSRIKKEILIEKEKEREKETETEKRFLSERNFHQNSVNKKTVSQNYFSDNKENSNLQTDGQILKMNNEIQVSEFYFFYLFITLIIFINALIFDL